MRLALWLVVSTSLLGLSYALLSACSGTQTRTYVPGTSSSAWQPPIQFPTTRLPQCKAHAYNAPGTFIVLTSLGNFSGSSFSDSGLSLWSSVSLKKGRQEIPIIRLPKLPNHYTIYYGTYKLSNGLVGCFYLAKAKYQGVSFHGVAMGAPLVFDFGTHTKFVAEGPLSIAVTGITGKSGSGMLSLKDASTGKTIHTGTVRIKNSIFVP